MEECEEPGCRYPAMREWHGRKVCADHFDMYRDKEDRILQKIDETG